MDGLCKWLSCPLVADAPPRRRGGCRESAVVHRWLPAQAPTYYTYYGYEDTTYYDDAGDDGDDVRPVWRYNFLLRNADLTFSAWVWATFSRGYLQPGKTIVYYRSDGG